MCPLVSRKAQAAREHNHKQNSMRADDLWIRQSLYQVVSPVCAIVFNIYGKYIHWGKVVDACDHRLLRVRPFDHTNHTAHGLRRES